MELHRRYNNHLREKYRTVQLEMKPCDPIYEYISDAQTTIHGRMFGFRLLLMPQLTTEYHIQKYLSRIEHDLRKEVYWLEEKK